MKKNIILTGILLLLATSCTNQIAEDILNKQTTEQMQYTNLEDGIKYGSYLINLASYCEDLSIPQDIAQALAKNPNDITLIIKAMQNLETQYVFGDTLAECEEYYNGWANFCTINNITRYYKF